VIAKVRERLSTRKQETQKTGVERFTLKKLSQLQVRKQYQTEISNQEGWYLNGTHKRLVYADDINILGGSIHTTKKNNEALVIASKETDLEVNAKKTKNMTMSRDHNTGQNKNIKISRKGGTIQTFGNNPNESKFHS
jgi:hypothetical protein